MYSDGSFENEPLSVFQSGLVHSSMDHSMHSTISGRISQFSMDHQEGDNGPFEPQSVPPFLLPPGFSECHSPVTGRLWVFKVGFVSTWPVQASSISELSQVPNCQTAPGFYP